MTEFWFGGLCGYCLAMSMVLIVVGYIASKEEDSI